MCTWVQTSNLAKVGVQNVLHVLKYKLEDMDERKKFLTFAQFIR